MKIKEYKIVHAMSAEALELILVTRIDQGWQPIGGVAIVELDRGTQRFAQAIVKYEVHP